MSDVEVRAAGGVVWRPTEQGGTEVLVVHRPRYDDWSLPKGKLDRGERWAGAALREVEEETGLICELGAPLVSVFYRDRRRRLKEVRYWAMQPLAGEFEPNKEVDVIEWLDLHTAMAWVTYEFDLYVLDSFEDILAATAREHA